MKKAVRILLIALAALLVIVLGYVAYVFIAYHRIPDHQALDVRPGESAGETVRAGDELTVLSWNIGFGAYEDDYSFFMDGGSESWAWSRERLNKNLSGISAELKSANADLYLLQEVDHDSTRTYHVDEREFLYAAQPGYASVYAVNYDSPFLFYPLHQPHGSSRAGLMTLTKLAVSSAERRSLPVETGVTKLVDLDRCYSVSRVPAEGGRELCLYNLHLSAYSSDGSIADEQLRMLLSDMQAEVERGNYVIGGGDFNKDLLPGGSAAYFGVSAEEHTWAQPIRTDLIDSTALSPRRPGRSRRARGLLPQRRRALFPRPADADGGRLPRLAQRHRALRRGAGLRLCLLRPQPGQDDDPSGGMTRFRLPCTLRAGMSRRGVSVRRYP